MISTQSTFPVPLRDKTKIYLIDDHPLVRAGLKALIGATPDLEVCGEAEDSTTALRELAQLRPEVAVVDLSLKRSSGLELVQQIRATSPQTHVCVLSVYDESIYAIRAFKAGATGYLSKHLDPPQVLNALRKIGRGEKVLSGRVIPRMLDRPGAEFINHPVMALTDRELEIARSIGQGFTVHAIANSLKLSTRAVESHRQRLRQKLNLRTSTDLLRFCYELASGESPDPGIARDQRAKNERDR